MLLQRVFLGFETEEEVWERKRKDTFWWRRMANEGGESWAKGLHEDS